MFIHSPSNQVFEKKPKGCHVNFAVNFTEELLKLFVFLSMYFFNLVSTSKILLGLNCLRYNGIFRNGNCECARFLSNVRFVLDTFNLDLEELCLENER